MVFEKVSFRTRVNSGWIGQLSRAGLILVLLGPGNRHLAAQDPVSQSSGPKAGADSASSITLRNTVEDWSEITLNKSELTMKPPTPGELDDLPKYTRERWQVQWRDMDPIDLYIIKPKGIEKPPVILYLYSEEVASKQPFINDGWCQRVTSGGFAAVAFVPALTEDRFQMRPMKQTFFSELPEALATTTHDVQMVLNYLEERKDMDLGRVGIFGTGSGAGVAVLAAAADSRIKALDLIDPWSDWPDWLKASSLVSPLEKDSYLRPQFLARVAPLDPVRWLPKLSSDQVRIQFIDELMVRQKASMDALEHAAPKSVTVLHFATQAQHKQSTAGGQTFQWVKEQLQQADPRVPGNAAQVSGDAATAKP